MGSDITTIAVTKLTRYLFRQMAVRRGVFLQDYLEDLAKSQADKEGVKVFTEVANE